MNFLKSINQKSETFRNIGALVFTENDIKKAIEDTKKYVIEKINKFIQKWKNIFYKPISQFRFFKKINKKKKNLLKWTAQINSECQNPN